MAAFALNDRKVELCKHCLKLNCDKCKVLDLLNGCSTDASTTFDIFFDPFDAAFDAPAVPSKRILKHRPQDALGKSGVPAIRIPRRGPENPMEAADSTRRPVPERPLNKTLTVRVKDETNTADAKPFAPSPISPREETPGFDEDVMFLDDDDESSSVGWHYYVPATSATSSSTSPPVSTPPQHQGKTESSELAIQSSFNTEAEGAPEPVQGKTESSELAVQSSSNTEAEGAPEPVQVTRFGCTLEELEMIANETFLDRVKTLFWELCFPFGEPED